MFSSTILAMMKRHHPVSPLSAIIILFVLYIHGFFGTIWRLNIINCCSCSCVCFIDRTKLDILLLLFFSATSYTIERPLYSYLHCIHNSTYCKKLYAHLVNRINVWVFNDENVKRYSFQIFYSFV